jgi:hypothetical protein
VFAIQNLVSKRCVFHIPLSYRLKNVVRNNKRSPFKGIVQIFALGQQVERGCCDSVLNQDSISFACDAIACQCH